MRNQDEHDPELAVVCGRCDAELTVTAGLNAADVAWVHEQRCARITCSSCEARILPAPGFNAHESMWMHELECPALDALAS